MREQVDTNKQIIKSFRLSQKQWQTIQTQMQEKNLNFSQLVLNSLLHQNSQTPTKFKKQKANYYFRNPKMTKCLNWEVKPNEEVFS